MKNLFIIAGLIFSLIGCASASDVLTSKVYPSTVTDVRSLAIWLQENFQYQDEDEDYWKSPEETVRDKGGDCEDFAILSSVVLDDLKIKSYILVVTYIDEQDAHAITVFENGRGGYDYFSNNALIKMNAPTLRGLLNRAYHNWRTASFVTKHKVYYYKVYRK